jgi:hypothetical protein
MTRKNDEAITPSDRPWTLKLDGLIRDPRGNIIVVCYNMDDAEHIVNCVNSHEEQHGSPRTGRCLPPDPEGKNFDRAAWADKAISAFRRESGTDLEDALPDLLADFMHWSDRAGYDFDLALDRARGHYEAETGEPGEA